MTVEACSAIRHMKEFFRPLLIFTIVGHKPDKNNDIKNTRNMRVPSGLIEGKDKRVGSDIIKPRDGLNS